MRNEEEIPGIVQLFGSNEAHTRIICATECSGIIREHYVKVL